MLSHSSPFAERWTRVNRRNRCLICDRDSWCQITLDGLVAKCMRVADGSFKTGEQKDGNQYYLHHLGHTSIHVARPPQRQVRPAWDAPDLVAHRAVYGLVVQRCAVLPPRAMAEIVRRFGPYADRVIAEFGIGYCDTTTALVESLNAAGRRYHAIDAGVLTAQGHVCRSLRGKLLIPYRRDGLVWDIRGSGLKDDGDTKAKSLLGGYAKRGVKGTFFNHDALGALDDGSTIHLAGGEWKAIALALAGLPTIGTRGEGELDDEQLAELTAAGVVEVVLHIDAENPKPDRPRTMAGLPLSAGRDLGLRKAQRLVEAGFRVRVAEPTRQPGSPKVDPDSLLRDAGEDAVRAYAAQALPLKEFRTSIGLLAAPTFRPTARRAMTIAAESVSVPPDSTLARVEADMRDKLHAFLHEQPESGATLVLTPPPGVGKTRQVLVEAQSLPYDESLAFFAPRHNNYGPEHEAAGLRHLSGRNAENCAHHEIADIVARKGHSVGKVLCKACPLRDDCTYYRQFEQSGPFFAPLSMLHTLDLHHRENAGSAEGGDARASGAVAAVVLDEVTPQDLVKEYSCSREALVRAAGDTRSAPAVARLATLLLRALDQQRATLASSDHGGSVRGAALLAVLTGLADGESHVRDLCDAMPPSIDAELEDLSVEAAQCLQDTIVPVLAGAIIASLAYRDAGQCDGILTLDARQGLYRFRRRRDVPDWLNDVPLVILNATGHPDTLLDVLGRDPASAEIYDPHLALPPEVEVIQLTDATYGKTTLTSLNPASTTLTHALDRVRAVLDPVLSTGLITFKGIEDGVGEALGIAPERRAHFGAVTGSNAYADLEQLVVLGTPSPSPDAVVELASAIHAGRTPLVEGQGYRLVPYPDWRDADGLGLSFEVVAFKDERIDQLYREMRDGELFQAAHRLRVHRPNGRARMRLILATALPLPALPPTQLVRSVGRGSTAEKDARIASLSTALASLVAEHGSAMQADLAKAAKVAPSTVSKYWSDVVARAGLVIGTRVQTKGATTRPIGCAVPPTMASSRREEGAGHESADDNPVHLTNIPEAASGTGTVPGPGRPTLDGKASLAPVIRDPRPDLYEDSARWACLLAVAYCRDGKVSGGVYTALHEARRVGGVLYRRGEQSRIRPVDAAAQPEFTVVVTDLLQPHRQAIAALLREVLDEDVAA